MEMMAAMHPKFLRLPGGNYLEGDLDCRAVRLEEHDRPAGGPADAPQPVELPVLRMDWACLSFWSGAEDLNMQTVLAVYAGYSFARATTFVRVRTLDSVCGGCAGRDRVRNRRCVDQVGRGARQVGASCAVSQSNMSR
jgi:hypothetical protein